MAIVYPLTAPTELLLAELEIMPLTNVGYTESPFTFATQTLVWPGQRWALRGPIPAQLVAKGDNVTAFLLSLNGVQGTFRFGDPSRLTTRGTAAGACTCGAGNVADSTTLVTIMAGGSFAVGDWLQIGNYLHKVIKVVDATHYDVWPRLRSAYANGTAITYSGGPKGLFRLADNDAAMRWKINSAKHYGYQLDCVEAL